MGEIMRVGRKIICGLCSNEFTWFYGDVQEECPQCHIKELTNRITLLKMENIEVFKLHEDAILPVRAHNTDGGLDLFALKSYDIKIGETVKVETGIAVYVPMGHVGRVLERSSMANKGWAIGAGCVDALYSGSVDVVMRNFSNAMGIINKGDKIAQLVIQPCLTMPVKEIKQLWTSERGNKGFGSSGV